MNISKRIKYSILVLFIFLAYAPSLRVSFILDDNYLVGQNPTLHEFSISSFKKSFQTSIYGNLQEGFYFRPLQTLVDKVNYQIWGLRPFGFHLTNILFHIGCCILLLKIFELLGFHRGLSFLSVLLFSVHPMNTDLFLLVTNLNELMVFFFSLLTLLAALSPSSNGMLVVEGVSYSFALLSKESAVVVPLVLILIRTLFSFPIKIIRHLIILGILTLFYLTLRHMAVGAVFVESPKVMMFFVAQAFPKVLFIYLKSILIPWGLHFPRMIPSLSHYWGYYFAVFLLISFSVAVKGSKHLKFASGWGLLFLLPKTFRMAHISAMMDHWVYPILPVVIFILVEKIWVLLPAKREFKREGRFLLWAILILYTFLCQFYIQVKGSNEKILRWLLKYENLYSARFKLGVLLYGTGRPFEALPYLEMAYENEPDNMSYGNGLAMGYWKAGFTEKALAVLKKCAAKDPTHQPTFRNLELISGKK